MHLESCFLLEPLVDYGMDTLIIFSMIIPKDCTISNTHGECGEYSFIAEGHRTHRISHCSHLPVPGQGAATRLLRLEDGRVLVLLVVVGVDVIVGDVDVDHAPLLQLLGVQLVHVLLL